MDVSFLLSATHPNLSSSSTQLRFRALVLRRVGEFADSDVDILSV